MPEQYEGLGLTFLYPDSWLIDHEPEGDAVSLESPDGAFMTISRFSHEADVTAALDKAVATMQEEYDEIEREATRRRIGGCDLQGLVLRFVYLDLIVTSQLLTFPVGSWSYLIQIQAEDRENDRLQPVFEAVLTSLCQNLKCT